MPYHNILYLTSFANNGFGGQESLFYLVKNIAKELFYPIVGLPGEGGLKTRLEKSSIDARIVKLSKLRLSNLPNNLSALANLRKVIRENHIELIHTDSVRNTFYAGVAGKLEQKPVIWHIRTCDNDRYDRMLYHLSSKIILVAGALRSRFPWDSHHKSKLVTVHNGVDFEQFYQKKPDGLHRKKYGVRPDDILISVIARIDPVKGQKYIIKAAEQIKKHHNRFFIVLAGEIVDKKYLQECKDMVKKCGLQVHVAFAGHLSDVNGLLADTDIVVLPSTQSEGFPRAVIEAMAASKPVVATDVGGSSEAVEDQMTGFIVNPYDPSALAEKIILLVQDKNLRKRFGSQGRLRASKMFGIHKNVNLIENLYKNILEI